jgi:hypothetical protein
LGLQSWFIIRPFLLRAEASARCALVALVKLRYPLQRMSTFAGSYGG